MPKVLSVPFVVSWVFGCVLNFPAASVFGDTDGDRSAEGNLPTTSYSLFWGRQRVFKFGGPCIPLAENPTPRKRRRMGPTQPPAPTTEQPQITSVTLEGWGLFIYHPFDPQVQEICTRAFSVWLKSKRSKPKDPGVPKPHLRT